MDHYQVTLDNCADEPIHIPNLIQPNGFLLAVRISDITIIQVSDNTMEHLALDAGHILQRPLFVILPNVYTKIKKNINKTDLAHFDAIRVIINKRKYICVPHCYQANILILEFEYESNSQILNNNLFLQQLNVAVLNIQRLKTYHELVNFVAKTVKQLTGYDRVMVYKFDHDYNGDVIAEEKLSSLNSFLHHKFPASDIPQQARALYLKNWVRLINDVDYVPVGLLPAINAVTGEYVDLSKSFLRSVSPIHIEYLKNMQVKATLTISIVVEDKLWGLIACHHYQPKYLNYDQRMGIEFFGKVLSNNWQMIEMNNVRTFKDKSLLMGNHLMSAIRFSNNLNETLTEFTDDLLEITGADGLVIQYDEEYLALGKVPNKVYCVQLMQWLLRRHDYNTFQTNELQRHFAPAKAFPHLTSGILTVGFNVLGSCRIIWFRSEFMQSVDWGGNPNEKTLTMIDEDNYRLTPRKSFDKWTEAIKNRSKDWEVYHLEAANIFKSNFAEILAWRNSVYKQQKDLLEVEVKSKTEEITHLYEQLLAQYTKLEAVAFEQSHIVRGPLSTIMGLLNLLETETDEKEIGYIHSLIKAKTTEMDQVIMTIISKID